MTLKPECNTEPKCSQQRSMLEGLFWPLGRTLEVLEVFVQRFNKGIHIVSPQGQRTYLSVEFRL